VALLQDPLELAFEQPHRMSVDETLGVDERYALQVACFDRQLAHHLAFLPGHYTAFPRRRRASGQAELTGLVASRWI
jgi:hypothetical protein